MDWASPFESRFIGDARPTSVVYFDTYIILPQCYDCDSKQRAKVESFSLSKNPKNFQYLATQVNMAHSQTISKGALDMICGLQVHQKKWLSDRVRKRGVLPAS